MEIKISSYLMKKIEKFANDRVGLSEELYRKRGEEKVNKMIEDIIVGTMCEYAVYQMLKDKGLNCTKPDLKIYEAKDKSFSADLQCGDHLIHVKGQSKLSIKRYGHSWLVQRYDALYANPKDEDVFAFCAGDVETKSVTFLGFCKPIKIKEHELWRECKVPMFRRTKVALYLIDFANYDIMSVEFPEKL